MSSDISDFGTWLREHRLARGLTRTHLAHLIIDVAHAAGDSVPGTRAVYRYIYRWERGDGASERYQLYCH
jgi:hypothetical protein